LNEEISPLLARYAFLEGEIRQGLMLGSKAEHGEYDAWIILLRRLAKQASRPTRRDASLPGYDEARDAVDTLAAETATALEDRNVGPELESWHQLNEALRVRHFAQRLRTLSRGWRWQEPRMERWPSTEFYRNTRQLSAFVVAMIAFESHLQLVRYQRSLELLANLAIAAGARPREVEVEPRRRVPRR
jgi:hypothetical protein